MKKTIILFLLLFGIITSAQTQDYSYYRQTKVAGGFQLGMLNGVGGQFTFLISNFADDFPFAIKLAGGFSFPDAGDPLAARRIFINNNTNGVAESSARTYDFSMDFMLRKSFLGLKRNYFYVGPRYTMFSGNFNYVGGNEDFDVTSDQWGIGLGMENHFRIISSMYLVLNFGYDYFISETLYGHDTAYSPDGVDINPREDYTFDDADEAINQPQHQIKALIGFNFILY